MFVKNRRKKRNKVKKEGTLHFGENAGRRCLSRVAFGIAPVYDHARGEKAREKRLGRFSRAFSPLAWS